MVRLFAVLFVAAAASSAFGRDAGAAAPQDVTFAGDLRDGGQVLVTLTPDRDAVTRVELRQAVFLAAPPDTEPLELGFSGVVYYAQPLPIEDGAFISALGQDRSLTTRSYAEVASEVTSSGALSGTATYYGCVPPGCQAFAGSDWTATGPVDTPPSPSDRVIDGDVDGGGSLSIAVAADGAITAFEITDVPIEDCLPGSAALSLRAFFEPAATGDLSNVTVLADGAYLYLGVVVDDETSGTIRVADGAGCAFESAWRTGELPTETPTIATNTPSIGGLPETGGGADRSSPWLPIVAGLAVASVLALLAVRVRLRQA